MVELLVFAILLFIAGVGATVLWDKHSVFIKDTLKAMFNLEQRRVVSKNNQPNPQRQYNNGLKKIEDMLKDFEKKVAETNKKKTEREKKIAQIQSLEELLNIFEEDDDIKWK